MKLYLEKLPYTTAFAIIDYCWKNEIDRYKCKQLLDAMSVSPVPSNIEWTLSIPETHLTYIYLKWDLYERATS